MAQVAVPDPALVFGIDPAELEGLDEIAAEHGFAIPTTGGVDAVVEALGRGDSARAVAALTEDYVIATDRHRDLLAALQLPTFPAGWEHRISDGTGRCRYDGPALAPTV